MKTNSQFTGRGLFLIVLFWVLGSGNLWAAQDVGYNVTSGLWAKAVLEVSGNPVTLVWSEVGTDTTPSGATVVSGFFYADPADFAYGSPYNPELFVKVYIAPDGWCNMAFNHVTVDPVTIYSAHNYVGTADQTGQATLDNRLVEHTYTGVGTGTVDEGSVTGNWNGGWDSIDGSSGNVTCTLTQSGSSVSGTMTVYNTDCGTMSNVQITGSESALIPGRYTFNASTTCDGDNVEFDFSGNLSGDTLSGNYTQKVGGDGYDSGSFSFSR